MGNEIPKQTSHQVCNDITSIKTSIRNKILLNEFHDHTEEKTQQHNYPTNPDRYDIWVPMKVRIEAPEKNQASK